MNKKSSRTRLRHRLRVPMGLLVVLLSALSMYAYAEWAVSDKTTQDRINDANKILGDKRNGTVTRSLQYLREVDKGDFSKTASGQKRYDDPSLKWEKKDYDKPSSVKVEVDQRCVRAEVPAMPKINGVQEPQLPKGKSNLFDASYELCKEIVETEKAQFKYNLMMSELAGKRYERYWAIADERNKLKENDAGKLQSNTNKMTALLTLIGIDAAQQKSYNDVYNARITYLKASRDALAMRVMSGGGGTADKPSAGGTAGGPTGAAGNADINPIVIDMMHRAFSSNAVRAERADEVRGIE